VLVGKFFLSAEHHVEYNSKALAISIPQKLQSSHQIS
jgi:hypothetical protein